MHTTSWTPADTERAIEIWRQYQRTHDVSEEHGRTVGIDPVTGRIWFGESATDVVAKMNADGVHSPPFCLRVGHEYYVRKRGRLATTLVST